AGEVLKVQRDKRRRAASGANLIIELFKRADGPRNCDDMRAGLGQPQGRTTANAARGTRNDRNAVFERAAHCHPLLFLARTDFTAGAGPTRGSQGHDKVGFGDGSISNRGTYPASAKSDSCRTLSRRSASVRRVG